MLEILKPIPHPYKIMWPTTNYNWNLYISNSNCSNFLFSLIVKMFDMVLEPHVVIHCGPLAFKAE